jgi:hypothetical protein
MSKTMLGWHFLADDRRMQYGDRSLVEVGKTYKVVGQLKRCENGMHGSKRIIDALQYAPGSICCKVELVGEIIEDTDKVVARARRVIAMVDASGVLHEFACLCAEKALKLIKGPIDPRLPAAIMAKRAWLSGKISTKELAAARDAAWAAARDAARDAAWAAAMAAARAEQNDILTRLIEEKLDPENLCLSAKKPKGTEKGEAARGKIS